VEKYVRILFPDSLKLFFIRRVEGVSMTLWL